MCPGLPALDESSTGPLETTVNCIECEPDCAMSNSQNTGYEITSQAPVGSSKQQRSLSRDAWEGLSCGADGGLDTRAAREVARAQQGPGPFDVVCACTAPMKPGAALIGPDFAMLDSTASADIDGKGVTDLHWEPGAHLPLQGGRPLEQPSGPVSGGAAKE